MKDRLQWNATDGIWQDLLSMRMNHTTNIAESLEYLRVNVSLDVSSWCVRIDCRSICYVVVNKVARRSDEGRCSISTHNEL
jgi:hypothetical protein